MPTPKAECFDCLIPYDDFPDLLIPTWAWNKISPYGPGVGKEGGAGLLCPTCICRRLEKAKINKIPSVFVSGPLAYGLNEWI